MRAETAFVGARAVDSLPFSMGGTAAQARALKASGVDCMIGYLGSMNAARLAAVLDAGLAFMPVTLAGEYEDGGADEVAQLRALGIPAGATVWLDLEGLKAWKTSPPELIAKINAWADAIIAGGWMPGLYVGAPQPLTSRELYQLRVQRYWWGLGKPIDRMMALVYPDCGWCMIQQWHGQPKGMVWKNTGVLVDTNGIQMDHRNRLPVWVVASDEPANDCAA
jgi:hypothetical protein